MSERILVVDDEEIIRESLSFVLKKEGYFVEEAENGKIAYDMVLQDSYDLIITDIEMPGMKGTQLLEEVKKINIQTLIVIITAYGSLETDISAMIAIKIYIVKSMLSVIISRSGNNSL